MDPSRAQPDEPSEPQPESNGTKSKEALRQALNEVQELKQYASQYLSAQADRFRLSVRKVIVAAVLGILALLVGISVVVVAVSLMLIGLSGAIATSLGGRVWAGHLIVGGGVLLVLALGSWLGVRMFFASSRTSTIKRYESRIAHQRQSHGHDARERSAAEG